MSIGQPVSTKSPILITRSFAVALVGLLLVLSVFSFVFSIRDEMALQEIKRQHPEIIWFRSFSFLPGFRGFLLLAGAWGAYRRTFFSLFWSCLAVMVGLLFYQVAFIFRVFTWGPTAAKKGEEWAGVYRFLQSLDSPYVFQDLDFAIIGFMVIILVVQLASLGWYGIRNRSLGKLLALLVLVLLFVSILARNYQTWPTGNALLERQTQQSSSSRP